MACATNPVTGRRELSLISESQEIQMGQQAAAEVRQSMGLGPGLRVAAVRPLDRACHGEEIRATEPALVV
ncbi:MAG: hypothetical protein R2882_13845 [Gemmatimonadales bacterium]